MKKLLAIIFLYISVAHLSAQAQGWQLPESKAVMKGTLPNGLAYYICKSEAGTNSCFRMIQRTGASIEEPSEYGYSHFVEHLLFGGTAHYPGRELIDFVRRQGIKYGDDFNASTSYCETYYWVEAAPSENKEVVDSCLLALKEMMYEAVLADSTIDKERNVIIQEYLTRQYERTSRLLNPFPHPVIGDTAIIRHCHTQDLRDFYHRWYQPQLQAIVVCTPYDKEWVLEKIRNVFGSVPRGSTVAPVPFTPSSCARPQVEVIPRQEKEEDSQVNLYIRQSPLSVDDKRSLEGILPKRACFYLGRLLRKYMETYTNLGSHCVVALLDSQYGDYQQFYIRLNTKERNIKIVLDTFVRALEQIRKEGFLKEMLEECGIAQNYASNEIKLTVWKQSDEVIGKDDAKLMAEQCVKNFLYGDPIIDEKTWEQINAYYDAYLDAERLHRIFCQLYGRENQVYIIHCHDGVEIETELQGIIENAQSPQAQQASPRQTLKPKNFIATEPHFANVPSTQGTIIARRDLYGGNVREVMLSNGIKVLLSHTDSIGTLEFYAFREGGYGVVAPKMDKALSKLISCEEDLQNEVFYSHLVTESCDEYNMSYNNEDVEQGLKAFYDALTQTKIDTVCLTSRIEDCYTPLIRFFRKENVPKKHEVASIVDKTLKKTDIDHIQKMWREYKSNYHGMVVSIEHSLNEDSLLALVTQYIGSLPYKKEPMRMNDRNVAYFISKDSTVIDTISSERQDWATIIFFQDKGLQYNPEHVVLHNALVSILEDAITNKIRLEHGAVYSPIIMGEMTQFPHAEQIIKVSFSCATGMVEQISQDIVELFTELAHGCGITQQMVDNYIRWTEEHGGYTNLYGGKAQRELLRLQQHGVVVDTNMMNLRHVVTPRALRLYMQDLLENGHCYKHFVIGSRA